MIDRPAADRRAVVALLIAAPQKAIPAAVCSFGVVAIFLILIGEFRSALVYLVGVPVAAAAIAIALPEGRSTESRALTQTIVCDALALLGAIVWAAVNMHYSA